MFLKHHPLRAADAGEDTGGGETDITDDTDTTVTDDDPADLDRGDEVDPPLNKDALAKVAEGAEDDDPDAGTDAEPAGKKGSNHVPIGRFNEVNEEKKRLERELAELKAAGPKPAATPEPTKAPEPKFDEDKAELDYANLLADGKFTEAAALRKQINANLREQARQEAEANVEARQAARETTQTLTQVAQQAVKDWPYLDTEDGADTMDLIIAARDGLHAKGVPLPEALRQAVAKIAPKFAPEGSGTPGKDVTHGTPRVDTRSQQAAARGADASGRQPPRADIGAGNRAGADKLDVETMSEEQFDALTPAQKKRLRGDE